MLEQLKLRIASGQNAPREEEESRMDGLRSPL
jgi:hypothetical protein